MHGSKLSSWAPSRTPSMMWMCCFCFHHHTLHLSPSESTRLRHSDFSLADSPTQEAQEFTHWSHTLPDHHHHNHHHTTWSIPHHCYPAHSPTPKVSQTPTQPK
ncbi:hypothetical protein BDZ85DRAFT_263881 [Elsinoe ampelina]|uniref:Uncharacterized protein n=1 Tax=Elsinoe ampelina TaxID=302913 RepID=A0A6A6GB22_9PEZI|nr:hypothetical protein BDZ85DRAFT_263881 [Elsinoe ampelina]